MKKIKVNKQKYNYIFEDDNQQQNNNTAEDNQQPSEKDLKKEIEDNDKKTQEEIAQKKEETSVDPSAQLDDNDTSADSKSAEDVNTSDNKIEHDDLNDNDEATEDTPDEQPKNNTSFNIKFEGATSDETKLIEFCKQNVVAQRFKDISFFNVKLTQSFADNVKFPTANTQLQSLMLQTTMPKKFRDVYKSYDNNPLLTIEKAEDKAKKYFNIFTSTNESVDYYGNPLNEVGATAFSAGMSISKALAVGSLQSLSFLGGLVPGIGAIMGMGMLAASGNGEYFTNDKELKKQYSDEVIKKDSEQTAKYQAIDNYVNSIMIAMEQSVRHITSDQGLQAFSDLHKVIISILGKKTKSTVQEVIKNNNDELKKSKDSIIAKLKKSNNNLSLFKKQVERVLKNDEFAKTEQGKKISKDLKDLHDEEKDNIFDSLATRNYTSVLNEADVEEIEHQKIQFDADELYKETVDTVRQYMVKIFNSKPENWDIVKNARKQMEAMKKGADEEIKKSIEHVCRTANSGQMNLGGKLMAFVSKHPMRAARLTNLWNRHMVDLDQRIEQRIKQISELDGKGPLGMAREFYMDTFPALIGMMVTYKTLLEMYSDNRLYDPSLILTAVSNNQQIKDEDYINVFLDGIAEIFSVSSPVLNDEGINAITTDSDDVAENSLSYVLAWILQLNPGDGNAEHIENCINNSQILRNIKTKNALVTKIANMLIELNLGSIEACLNAMKDSFAKLDTTQIKDVSTILKSLNTDISKLLQNETAPLILQYVYATNGEILTKFNRNIQRFTADNIDFNNTQIVQSLRADLGIDELTLPDNAKDANAAIIKATGDFEQMFNNGELILDFFYRAYYDLGFNKFNSKDLNINNTLLYFIQMIENVNIGILLSDESVKTGYAELERVYSREFSTPEDYTDFVNIVTNGDKAQASALSLETLNIDDKNKYEAFKNNLTSVNFFKCAENNIDKNLLNNPEFKEIQSPFNSYKDIIPSLLATDAKWPKPIRTISDLFNVEDELQKSINWKTDGLVKLKELATYILQCIVKKYNTNDRNYDKEFEDTLSKNIIPIGDDKTTSLLELIKNWQFIIRANISNEQRALLQQLIDNADNNLNEQFKDGNIETGFFRSLIAYNPNNSAEHYNFADPFDVAAFIEKNIIITDINAPQQNNNDDNDDNVQQTTSPELMSKFKVYLNTALQAKDKVFSAMQAFFKTPTTLNTEEENQAKNATTKNNGQQSNEGILYFGYQQLFEDVSEVIDTTINFINTPEGYDTLHKLLGNDVTEPLSNNDEETTAESDTNIDKSAIEFFNIIHQGIKKSNQFLLKNQYK